MVVVVVVAAAVDAAAGVVVDALERQAPRQFGSVRASQDHSDLAEEERIYTSAKCCFYWRACVVWKQDCCHDWQAQCVSYANSSAW